MSCLSPHTVPRMAEQGTEGKNDLGKLEAQANPLLRKARQECGNSSGELPPQKTRGCCRHHQSPAPCDHWEVLTPVAKGSELLQSTSHPPTGPPGLRKGQKLLVATQVSSSTQMKNWDGTQYLLGTGLMSQIRDIKGKSCVSVAEPMS